MALVLLLHFGAVSTLVLYRPIFVEHLQQIVMSVSAKDGHLHREPDSNLSIRLIEPVTPLILPPVIEIDSGTDKQQHHSDIRVPISEQEPRVDPQFPNLGPDLPAKFQQSGGSHYRIVVVVRALVLENGTIGDASVASSCGIIELDALALSYMKAHWHFLPATTSGKAVRDWVSVEVLFRSE